MEIKKVLEKELIKNLKKQELLNQEIDSLPLGSLVKIKQHNNIYCYLKYRKDDKVISKYIGKEDDINVMKLELDLAHKKNLINKLKSLKEDEVLINKMMKLK